MLPFVLALLLHIPKEPERLTAVPFATPAQMEWLHALEQCESTGSTTVRIIDSNGLPSMGILQFQFPLWDEYKSMGTTHENIYDKDLQERIATKVLNGGGWRAWLTCGKKVQKRLGAWPLP